MKIFLYFLIGLTFYITAIEALTPAQIAIQKHISGKSNSVILIKANVDQILKNGSIIKLDDGTKWRVDPDDTNYTSAWLGPAEIEIKKNKTPNSDYPYIMTNKWTKASVKVAKISQ